MKAVVKELFGDSSGIILVSIIAVTFILTSSIIGLVGALCVNQIADALTPYLGSDVRATNLVLTCRNAYIVSIVLADVMLIIWWAVSAQRRETQESPQYYPY
jgi:hypothetical protein